MCLCCMPIPGALTSPSPAGVRPDGPVYRRLCAHDAAHQRPHDLALDDVAGPQQDLPDQDAGELLEAQGMLAQLGSAGCGLHVIARGCRAVGYQGYGSEKRGER